MTSNRITNIVLGQEAVAEANHDVRRRSLRDVAEGVPHGGRLYKFNCFHLNVLPLDLTGLAP